MQVIKKRNGIQAIDSEGGSSIVNYDDLENNLVFGRGGLNARIIYSNFDQERINEIGLYLKYRMESFNQWDNNYYYEYTWTASESGLYDFLLDTSISPHLYDNNRTNYHFFCSYLSTDPYRVIIQNDQSRLLDGGINERWEDHISRGWQVIDKGQHLYWTTYWRCEKGDNFSVYSEKDLLEGTVQLQQEKARIRLRILLCQ